MDPDMDITGTSFSADPRPLRSPSVEERRWLECAAAMAVAGKAAAQPLWGTAAGRVELGRGAGGDHTLEIDRACETAMRETLAAKAPAGCRLVSEEAGVVGEDDASWCVVLDPVDGSLNAKHGLQPFGASIGVARTTESGSGTLADMTVGYIEDYVRPQAFAAIKDVGLVPTGEARPGGTIEGTARAAVDRSRSDSEQVEVMLLEAGRPDRHDFCYQDLSMIAAGGQSKDMRVRQIGSIALSLCYLAVGVADVLVAAVRARSVDLAAGFLILSEAGGGVTGLDEPDVWSQPLDLEKRGAFVAWRAGLDGDDISVRAHRLGPKLLLGSQ